MKRKSSRGFSLIEGMFAMLIVSIVLGALTQVLKQAAEVKKNTRNMDQSSEEFHSLLTMKSDILAALNVSVPGPGASASALVLERVNPQMSFSERTDILSDPLDPFEVSERVKVEYKIEDGRLKRFLTPTSQPTTTTRMLIVETLSLTRDSSTPSLLTITLTKKGTRVTKTRSIKAMVRP